MTDALALFDTAPDLRTDGGRTRCPACGTLTAAHNMANATSYDGPRVCLRCYMAGAEATTLPLDDGPDPDDQDPNDTLYPSDTDPDAWPVQPDAGTDAATLFGPACDRCGTTDPGTVPAHLYPGSWSTSLDADGRTVHRLCWPCRTADDTARRARLDAEPLPACGHRGCAGLEDCWQRPDDDEEDQDDDRPVYDCFTARTVELADSYTDRAAAGHIETEARGGHAPIEALRLSRVHVALKAERLARLTPEHIAATLTRDPDKLAELIDYDRTPEHVRRGAALVLNQIADELATIDAEHQADADAQLADWIAPRTVETPLTRTRRHYAQSATRTLPDDAADPWHTPPGETPARVGYRLTFDALADLGHADPTVHLRDIEDGPAEPSTARPCHYCKRPTLARFNVPQRTTRAAWLPVCPPCSHDLEHRTGGTLF